MKTTSEYLIDILDDMLYNLKEGEYDGCNGPWEREMLYDIECHPSFKKIEGYPKTPEAAICSVDILNLVKYMLDKQKGDSNGTS